MTYLVPPLFRPLAGYTIEKDDLATFSIQYLIQHHCNVTVIVLFVLYFRVDDVELLRRKANISLKIMKTFVEAYNDINSFLSKQFILILTTTVVYLLLLLLLQLMLLILQYYD